MHRVLATKRALLINDFITSNNIGVACITESWLQTDDTVDITILESNDYTLSHVTRAQGRGGGVGVLYKSCYKMLSMKSITCDQFEGMKITLKHPNQTQLHLIVIYRPPSGSKSMFLEPLGATLQEATTNGDNVVICGDFNVPYNRSDSKEVEAIKDIINHHGFHQNVHMPTHTHGNILDWIITPNQSHILASKPRTTFLLSDHYVVECEINFHKPRPPTKSITYRKLSSVDDVAFALDIVEATRTMDTISDYNTGLHAVLDAHCPLVSRTVTERTHQPWHTRKITDAKRALRKLERKKDGQLRRHINVYSKLLYTTKCDYYHDTISKAKKNPKELFNITDTLLGRKKKTTLPDNDNHIELANNFQSYFTQKVENIHTKVGYSAVQHEIQVSANASLLRIPALFKSDVISIVAKMKAKSCTLDPIPAKLFKQHIQHLAPVISRILNNYILDSVVPTDLKSSVITPVYKKKQLDTNALSSYRPIAQLPLVAKILERHVSAVLRNHMENNNIADLYQSAYRANHSTETAIVKVFNDISLSLGKHKKVVLCLLDLSAAFDTLNHEILIKRLRNIGIEGGALKWFQSYLSGRTTAVKIGEAISAQRNFTHGVPQGSVLGPMLFNIYCLPLGDVISRHNIQYHMYADDTQLYVEFPSNTDPAYHSALPTCTQDIKQWLSSNFLLLNDNKTEIIEFSVKKSHEPTEYKIGDSLVSTQQHATNLGCVLDAELTMEKHASKTCKSAFYHLNCIKKIRNCLPMDTCKLLTHALVTSRLDYCNAVFCDSSDAVIKQLERVQRQAARVVCKRYDNDHSSVTEMLWGLHWLPIRARIQYKILVLVFNAVNSGTPQYLADLIKVKQFTRTTRSARKKRILEIPPHGKGKHSRKAFSVVGPKMWNDILTDELRECTSADVFKKNLKTHLFRLSY